ncbi:MAG: phytochelatin synthase family protein [Rhodospirillaceae bacterium]
MPARFIIAFCFALNCLLAGHALALDVTPFDEEAAQQFFAQSQAKAGLWRLIHYYESQVDQTYCGVASATIVLNSLEVGAPPSPAIYPYRKFDQINFFSEAVLAVKPPKYVHMSGLTLDELGKMIASFGVRVDVHHAAAPLDLNGFRTLASAALSDAKDRVIVNYHRKPLGQEGGGHHSPLAAYDAVSDRFLILDVARYRLPPVWAGAAELWAAMNTEDTDAKANRGFIVIHAK